MYGRPYSVPQQQVGAYPQLVGAYPQLVGRHPYQQLVGAPPGYASTPEGYGVQPLIGSNPGSRGTVLVDGVPTQTRQWPFPMPDACASAGSASKSANTSQLIVRPQRLTITETTGPSVLTDITVGQRSQFINRGGVVPVAMFGPTAVDSLVNFDTAQIGNNITLEFMNNGSQSTIVSSSMLCVTAAY